MKILIVNILWILVLIIASDLSGQSNEGREFWLGFMEHKDAGQNDMVLLITSKTSTSGIVSVPGRDMSISFEVAANDVTVIQLPRYVETIGSEFVNANAINVTAKDDVSVYMHQYFGNRSEASVVLPKSSIGNQYYVVAFTGVPEGFFGPGIFPSEFLIVANEDETMVEYTLAAESQNGRRSGTTQSVLLNKGEVFQIRAKDPLDDLTGTFVSGNKDFSLFAGTSWSQVPRGCTAMDNLLEQMYPVSTWGTRYVASPFITTNNDLYRVIASEDATQVRIEGSTTTEILLDAGEFYDFQSPSGAFIEGTKAISVAQYITGSGCNGGIGDPSMVILNTVEQIRDTVTLFNSRFFEIWQNYINVITKAGEEDLVFIDGVNMVASGITFTSIGEDGAFLYATIPTQAGAHTLYTEGCGIIAMAYGYGDLESYAYSGGASFSEINENPIPEGGCLNDTILFSTGLPAERFNVLWDLGDNTTTTQHDFEHLYQDLGSYPLSLIIEDLCFEEIDTIYRDLIVSLRKDITAGDDQSGCEGTTISLEAFDLQGARFEWTGPSDFESDEQYPMIEDIRNDQAGLYQVVGNVSGCKTIPVEVAVEVFENPSPSLGLDTVLCTIDGDRLTLDAGQYTTYQWQDGSGNRLFDVTTDGDYFVTVFDDNNCSGVDTMTVIRQCPTRFYIPNIFSPNGDGVNDYFGVSGIELISMQLNVYDRWGQLVFTTIDEANTWDGNFMGEPMLSGEYVWTMQYEGYLEDATIFQDKKRGTVLMVR